MFTYINFQIYNTQFVNPFFYTNPGLVLYTWNYVKATCLKLCAFMHYINV